MTVEIILFLVFLLLVGSSSFSWYFGLKRQSETAKSESTKSYKTIEIRVSKNGENHFKDIEELYQSLSTLYKNLSYFDEVKGQVQTHVSFEILANQGSIRFLIRAEEGPILNTVQNYLKARFKQIDISQVPDEPIPLANFSQRKTAKIGLAKPDLLPLKSVKDFSDSTTGFVDPLASLMTTLSTLTEGEMIWMQYILTPMSQKWSKEGETIMAKLQQNAFSWAGKKQGKYIRLSMHMPIWLSVLTFPFIVIRGAIRLFTGKGVGAKHEFSPEIQEAIKLKTSKPLVDVQGRILYGAKQDQILRGNVLTEINQTFTAFGVSQHNAVKTSGLPPMDIAEVFTKRIVLDEEQSMKLNTEELALFWHPPTKNLASPFIHFIENSLEAVDDTGDQRKQSQEELAPDEAKGLARDTQERPMEYQPMLIRDATCLGVTDGFGKKSPFIIHDGDRRRHVYIIGQTGTGKSTLQEQMILSTIYKGQGCAVIDPHGELVEKVLEYIPSYRKNDVAWFDPSDTDNPPAFNILAMEKKGQELLATELLGIFHRMFENSWGPRMEQILYNTLMGLIEYPNATLTDIPAFITTKTFREECLKYCTDKNVIYFWHDQFDVLDPKMQKESVVAVLNKVEKFLNNKIVRGVFGAKRNRFNFDFVMNKQKILLVNLSKGKLSPQNSEIIGSMIVSRLLIDAMKRVQIPEDERKDFFLYIDEFQNFVSSTKTFESILSEARKYRLNLNIAHQYIAQVPDELRAAIFGNVGTVIAHRIGLEDAPTLVKQFGENDVSEEMLTTLAPFTFYSRSVRNNKITGVLKVRALRPIVERFPKLEDSEIENVIAFSKKQYCWNEEDRAAWAEKEQIIEQAKKEERESEERKKAKKAKGPLLGPAGGGAYRNPSPMGTGQQGMTGGGVPMQHAHTAPQGMQTTQTAPTMPNEQITRITGDSTPAGNDAGSHTGVQQTHDSPTNTQKQQYGEKPPYAKKPQAKNQRPKFDPFIPAQGNVIRPGKLYKPGPGKK